MPKKPAGKSNAVTIGCTSFPKWGFCKLAGCKRLQPHKEFATSDDGFFCEKHQKYGELLPARLVVTCKQGHLDEFPWVKWAHSNPDNPVPVCEDPKLKWKGGTHSSSLSSYKIKCETCDPFPKSGLGEKFTPKSLPYFKMPRDQNNLASHWGLIDGT